MTADEARVGLINSYISVIGTLWGFYYTVVLGSVSLTASILGKDGKLAVDSAIFIILLLAFFGIANLLAIVSMSNLVKRNIEALSDLELMNALQDQGYSPWSNYLQPVGWLAAIFFIALKAC